VKVKKKRYSPVELLCPVTVREQQEEKKKAKISSSIKLRLETTAGTH
jgi:hypothetical protein